MIIYRIDIWGRRQMDEMGVIFGQFGGGNLFLEVRDAKFKHSLNLYTSINLIIELQ